MSTPRDELLRKLQEQKKSLAEKIRQAEALAGKPNLDYAAHRARTSARGRLQSQTGRDIATDYPPPGNLERRAACERNLRLFLETYCAASFPLAWSDDHLQVIGYAQACVLEGGLFALGMPRGRGKTTIAIRTAIWALVYGHRRFLVLIGATEPASEAMLRALKSEVRHNDLLAEDFRQVCYPIRRLEGNARRQIGQLYEGQQTGIEWSTKRVVFPTVPDSACDGKNVSGACVAVAGITGAVRGLSYTLPTGEVCRPDLVLTDDPSTRESAQSPTQNDDRLRIIRGDVLGLAGPGRQISAMALVTVIAPGDLSDQLLDRKIHPEWGGVTTRAMYAWPTREDLWEQYRRIRSEGQRQGTGTQVATEFYRQHQPEMDEGARVGWPACKHPGQLSSVQNVMDLRQDLGDEAFFAEYMLQPLVAQGDDLQLLTADQIMGKLGGAPRGVPPLRVEHLTAAIDCHDNLLVWALAGWSAGFSGWLVDYGTWPKQPRRAWSLRKANPTLADAAPGAGREGAIRAGLAALTAELLGREWRREDGAALKVERCLVDSGYVTDLVYELCRHSPHAAVLMPSRGIGVGVAKSPMIDWPKKPGEKRGLNWILSKTPDRAGRYVRFSANEWKTFLHARLAVALGDPGCLSLWGQDPEAHRLLAQHLTSERPTLVSANGRSVLEWAVLPSQENHLLDALVMATVAASMLGVQLEGSAPGPAAGPGKTVSFSDLQRRARAS